jgi:hypothetical protein
MQVLPTLMTRIAQRDQIRRQLIAQVVAGKVMSLKWDRRPATSLAAVAVDGLSFVGTCPPLRSGVVDRRVGSHAFGALKLRVIEEAETVCTTQGIEHGSTLTVNLGLRVNLDSKGYEMTLSDTA